MGLIKNKNYMKANYKIFFTSREETINGRLNVEQGWDFTNCEIKISKFGYLEIHQDEIILSIFKSWNRFIKIN